MIFALVFMIYLGFKLLPMSKVRFTPTLHISYLAIYAIIPISACFMFITRSERLSITSGINHRVNYERSYPYYNFVNSFCYRNSCCICIFISHSCYFLMSDLPMIMLIQRLAGGLESVTLLAIPFFIMAGAL